MSTSLIITQKEGIKYIAGQKLVALGSTAAQRYVLGKQAKPEFETGDKIIRLLSAIQNEAELTEKEIEAMLYCLRSLAEEYEVPTVVPLLGGDVPDYVITPPSPGGTTVVVNHWRGAWDASGGTFPTTGGSGTGGAIQNGDTWHLSPGGILNGDVWNDGTLIIKITGGWLIKA